MGFFDEIKKVLFGVKSVSKSAADKVMDKGREVSEKSGEYIERAKDKVDDLGEKAENAWDNVIDSAEIIGTKVKSKAGDLLEDAKEFAEDVGEKVILRADDLFDDAKDIAEDVGEKVIDTAGKAFHKAKDLGDKFSDKVRDLSKKDEGDTGDRSGFDEFKLEEESGNVNSDDFTDALKDKAEDTISGTVVGDKVQDISSDLVKKAKELSETLSSKLDETIKKAEHLASQEVKEPEYKAPNENLRKSALDRDDFFKKAEAFADGKYDEVRDPFSTKPKIVGKVDKTGKSTDSSTPIPGFEDLDGDGDELIDDALLDSDEKE